MRVERYQITPIVYWSRLANAKGIAQKGGIRKFESGRFSTRASVFGSRFARMGNNVRQFSYILHNQIPGASFLKSCFGLTVDDGGITAKVTSSACTACRAFVRQAVLLFLAESLNRVTPRSDLTLRRREERFRDCNQRARKPSTYEPVAFSTGRTDSGAACSAWRPSRVRTAG